MGMRTQKTRIRLPVFNDSVPGEYQKNATFIREAQLS
jgi:hypothetical protein